jgi:hypothetical protein
MSEHELSLEDLSQICFHSQKAEYLRFKSDKIVNPVFNKDFEKECLFTPMEPIRQAIAVHTADACGMHAYRNDFWN